MILRKTSVERTKGTFPETQQKLKLMELKLKAHSFTLKRVTAINISNWLLKSKNENFI